MNEQYVRHSEIAVVGDESTALGFRLAGVHKHVEVEEGDQAGFEKELAGILESDRFGVVIVAENLLYRASERMSSKIQSTVIPIVVGVPDKHGSRESDDTIRKMMRKSLGFDLGGV